MQNIDELGFCFSHMGINCEHAEEARSLCEFMRSVFGFSASENQQSCWAGAEMEILKSPGAGSKGHICIGTTNFDKAVRYLEEKGVALDYQDVRYDDNGKMKVIYLKEHFFGFAVHLMQL